MNEDQYAERIANVEDRLRVLRARSNIIRALNHGGGLVGEIQKLADERDQLVADLADIRENGGFPD